MRDHTTREPARRAVTRRRFLSALAVTGGAAALAACGGGPPPTPTTAPKPAAPPKVEIGGQGAASPAAAGATAAGATTKPAAAATTAPAATAAGAATKPAAAATTASAATTAPAGATAAPAAKPAASGGAATEVTFSHIWATPPGAASKHPAEQLVDAFNARGGPVKVVNRVDSTDYNEILQKAQAELAAGKPPAMVVTPWSFIVAADAALGITSLEDIGAADVQQVMGNIRPESMNLVRLNGKTKGLAFALSCPIIYYNNDHFKAAGVDPKSMFKDWSSFAEMAPKLKARTNAPITGVGTNPDWPAQSLVQSNGGRVLNDDNEPVMDSAEAVAALKVFADLQKAGLYQSATPQENDAAFRAGTLATFVTSVAGLGSIRNGTAGKFELGTSSFPVFAGKQRRMSAGGSFLATYARDKGQQAGAWEFIRYVASKEGNDIWMKTGYINSTKHEVPLLPGQDAAYAQYNEGLTRETTWPGRRGVEIQKTWSTYVARIWANDLTAEEGTRRAKADILPLIKA